MSILVIDVGTSSLRAAVVGEGGAISAIIRAPIEVSRPAPGLVEFDAEAVATAAIATARTVIERAGPVAGVGVGAQRASAMIWRRSDGEPLAPAISWQDVRSAGRCLALQSKGLRLSPNQSATKFADLLDRFNPARDQDLCLGTVDSYLVSALTRSGIHVTDASNAAVTGLVRLDASDWDDAVLEELRIPRTMLPKIVDSIGVLGEATALPGAPPIGGLLGDQQASLIGQGCLGPNEAKATFGTGAMFDCVTESRPAFPVRGAHGSFPIVAWRVAGRLTWGIEAAMLSAGSCVDWIATSLGIVASPAETDTLASSVRDSGGVFFVPALDGTGAPLWDFGARGAFVGLSQSTTRAEVVRAVLEGIAHAGADLLEAAEADGDLRIDALHVDGGMSANRTFLQLVADASQRTVVPSPIAEATLLGAAFAAGSATGVWSSLQAAAGTIRAQAAIEPARHLDRERWFDARARALKMVPALSAVSF
ncbi:MAG: FGGY-family carbohydrate kinase [Acidimicrobiales bacterium]